MAGYRGLPNALAYGPTQAALINLAEILYLDLAPKGLGVSVVHPGFVATPMTATNEFRMPALITPEEAAQAIVRGWEDNGSGKGSVMAALDRIGHGGTLDPLATGLLPVAFGAARITT